jgi:hypothetical protein
VRALGVVVLLPCLDDRSRVRETAKPVEIQTLIAELAVKALDMGILCRFAWLDKVEGHAMEVGPSIQHLPSELGSVVDGNLLGRPTGGDELLEHTRDPLAR